MKKLIAVLILGSLPFLIFCQNEKAGTSPIEVLKNGCLVVRLESKHRKLKEISRLVEEGDLSDKTRATLSEKLGKMKSERDEKNKLWMEHFGKHFNFSKVLFTYDTTSMQVLKNQGGKGSFLNAQLEIDPQANLGNSDFVLARFGTTDSQEGTGLSAMIFQNADFKDLTKPFPYYVKLTSFGYYFNKILAKNIAEPRMTEKVVKKANAKLKDYYLKVRKKNLLLE